MDRISGLPDELLVKVLSLLPTKEVVSTSILSKRWESLWMWVPKLEFVINYNESDLRIRDFITKNLPLLKAPVIESFRLECSASSFQPEDIKHWVETTVSRCVRELDIDYYDFSFKRKPVALLPSSLYTCKSLVTLKLIGNNITVDVPPTVDLPSLKILELEHVKYSNQDSLRLLLSNCLVLEDLVIERDVPDNLKTIVVKVKSLLRLSLQIYGGWDSDGYEIVTPSLKYFKVTGLYTENFSYLKMHMPKVEEAHLSQQLFESITSLKHLSLSVSLDDGDEFVYRNGIVFNQLEHLELRIDHDYWSKLLVRLLEDSPKLRVLKIFNDIYLDPKEEYHELPSWNNDDQISVPKCLLESLETFEFGGYTGRQEERDVVSFIFKNAPHLKSSSIKDESMYHNGIVFNQLEHLKMHINHDYWSKLLVRLLEDSPKLRVLKLFLGTNPKFEEYESASWNNDESSVPKCLLESLEAFEFAGYTGRQEERDVVSYILKYAPHLKSSSISHVPCYNSE